jgi:hypothetical protein
VIFVKVHLGPFGITGYYSRQGFYLCLIKMNLCQQLQ